MKTKHWIIIFAAVLILSAAAWLIVRLVRYESKVAVIYQNGEITDEIDLNAVTEPYEITITGEDGSYNTVYVDIGEISMSAAACPDQICVNHGPISDGVEPIVCLPNKVTIQIEKADSDDADSFAR